MLHLAPNFLGYKFRKKAICLWLCSHQQRPELHAAGVALRAEFSFLLSWWSFPGSPSQAGVRLASVLRSCQASTVLHSSNQPHIFIVIIGRFGEKIIPTSVKLNTQMQHQNLSPTTSSPSLLPQSVFIVQPYKHCRSQVKRLMSVLFCAILIIKSLFLLRVFSGTEQMVQQVKYFLPKHEDVGSDAQQTYKSQIFRCAFIMPAWYGGSSMEQRGRRERRSQDLLAGQCSQTLWVC